MNKDLKKVILEAIKRATVDQRSYRKDLDESKDNGIAYIARVNPYFLRMTRANTGLGTRYILDAHGVDLLDVYEANPEFHYVSADFVDAKDIWNAMQTKFQQQERKKPMDAIQADWHKTLGNFVAEYDKEQARKRSVAENSKIAVK